MKKVWFEVKEKPGEFGRELAKEILEKIREILEVEE